MDIRQEYTNIDYMGKVQTFTYFGTQENPPGPDIHLYKGESDENNLASILSHPTLENLIKLRDYTNLLK